MNSCMIHRGEADLLLEAVKSHESVCRTKEYISFHFAEQIHLLQNKTPAMHRGIFRLQLINKRHYTEYQLLIR